MPVWTAACFYGPRVDCKDYIGLGSRVQDGGSDVSHDFPPIVYVCLVGLCSTYWLEN